MAGLGCSRAAIRASSNGWILMRVLEGTRLPSPVRSLLERTLSAPRRSVSGTRPTSAPRRYGSVPRIG